MGEIRFNRSIKKSFVKTDENLLMNYKCTNEVDLLGKRINFYGRKKGKKLSPYQKMCIEDYLPKIKFVETDSSGNLTKESINFEKVFGFSCPVWLEIGFGSGEHLLHLAKSNRSVGILGCEPYVNGVASLLGKIYGSDLSNIRIFMGDIRKILSLIPPKKLSKIFLLFPDPWPKKKHRRRRLLNLKILAEICRILKPGGLFYFASDVNDYTKQTLELFSKDNRFEWMADRPNDWRNAWENWYPTRYQIKALKAGRKINYIVFRKV